MVSRGMPALVSVVLVLVGATIVGWQRRHDPVSMAVLTGGTAGLVAMVSARASVVAEPPAVAMSTPTLGSVPVADIARDRASLPILPSAPDTTDTTELSQPDDPVSAAVPLPGLVAGLDTGDSIAAPAEPSIVDTGESPEDAQSAVAALPPEPAFQSADEQATPPLTSEAATLLATDSSVQPRPLMADLAWLPPASDPEPAVSGLVPALSIAASPASLMVDASWAVAAEPVAAAPSPLELVALAAAVPAPSLPPARIPTDLDGIRLSGAARAAASAALSGAVVSGLNARGDALLGAGDVTSARLFYQRAAEAGDGRAALLVGATFDPLFLAQIKVHGTRADTAVAADWYRLARSLGASDADRLLRRLHQN